MQRSLQWLAASVVLATVFESRAQSAPQATTPPAPAPPAPSAPQRLTHPTDWDEHWQKQAARLKKQLDDLLAKRATLGDPVLDERISQLRKRAEQLQLVAKQVTERLSELRATRPERRAARLAALSARLGAATLERPEVQAELAQHAERVAKLRRLAEVAGESGQATAKARAEALLSKENARHARALFELTTPVTTP